MMITTGIEAMAEAHGAYWLLDAIRSHQVYARVQSEEFQLWRLNVTGSTAVLTMRSDTDAPILVEQKIEYTDFPEPGIKMYCVRSSGTPPVLMLPDEY